MKQVVFYGHQNSLHIALPEYIFIVVLLKQMRSVIFNALRVLQPCGN